MHTEKFIFKPLIPDQRPEPLSQRNREPCSDYLGLLNILRVEGWNDSSIRGREKLDSIYENATES